MFCIKRKHIYLLLVLIVLIGFATYSRHILSKKTSSNTRASTLSIYGGYRVYSPNDYPFIVALLRPNGFILEENGNKLKYNAFNSLFCAGSLINDEWVVTAAHCVHDTNKNDIQVFVNTVSLRGEFPIDQKNNYIYPIERIITHPKFLIDKGGLGGADIALIKLSAKVKHTTQFIDLAKSPKYYETGLITRAIGWGDQEFGRRSQYLFYVDVPIISYERANQKSWYNGDVKSDMVAAGYADHDTCQGDSGGPLFYKDNNTFLLVGITSWGYGCGVAYKPGIYTKVINYQRWVNDTLELYSENGRGPNGMQ